MKKVKFEMVVESDDRNSEEQIREVLRDRFMGILEYDIGGLNLDYYSEVKSLNKMES